MQACLHAARSQLLVAAAWLSLKVHTATDSFCLLSENHETVLVTAPGTCPRNALPMCMIVHSFR